VRAMLFNHPLTWALLVSLCCLLIANRRRQKAAKQEPAGSQPNVDWTQPRGGDVAVPNKIKEEWDIREATFLYQTRGLGSNPCYLEATCPSQAKVTSVTKSKSPAGVPPPVAMALPDDFMNRFADKGRNMKRGSECEAVAHGVVEKKTGQTGGYIFTVSDIFWISPNDVEVSGGLRVGTTAGTSKTYYLKKVGSNWQVVGEHLKSISCG
jgi:hypothetical protein